MGMGIKRQKWVNQKDYLHVPQGCYRSILVSLLHKASESISETIQ